MERRGFLVLSSLGGLGLALGSHYWDAGHPLIVSCPKGAFEAERSLCCALWLWATQGSETADNML